MQRMKDIMEFLVNEGYDVYAPYSHSGTCTSPYVVVMPDKMSKITGISSTKQVYDIYCMGRSLTESMELKEKVEKSMVKMQPMIMPIYSMEVPTYDAETKSYVTVIEYRNVRKIEI